MRCPTSVLCRAAQTRKLFTGNNSIPQLHTLNDIGIQVSVQCPKQRIIGIGSVLPALSFSDDAVIVSSNSAQIRNYIGPERKKSLAESPTFMEMGQDVLKPSQSISYLDFARTTEMTQELVSWGGTMLAIKDRELARKSKVLIDDLINPLLEGLAMYSIIGHRKYYEGNTIVFESFTRLDNGTE